MATGRRLSAAAARPKHGLPPRRPISSRSGKSYPTTSGVKQRVEGAYMQRSAKEDLTYIVGLAILAERKRCAGLLASTKVLDRKPAVCVRVPHLKISRSGSWKARIAMSYTFPEELKDLRDVLAGGHRAPFASARQAAFVAQQLLGTRIKFPKPEADMTRRCC